MREERMNLRIAVVSSQNLKDLPVFRLFPYGCQYCLYWESTGDFDEKADKVKAQHLKGDWFRNVSREFGNCGVIAYSNNESVGYAQYALSKFFPRVRQYASGPPSDDSVFSRMFVYPEPRVEGKGYR